MHAIAGRKGEPAATSVAAGEAEGSSAVRISESVDATRAAADYIRKLANRGTPARRCPAGGWIAMGNRVRRAVRFGGLALAPISSVVARRGACAGCGGVGVFSFAGAAFGGVGRWEGRGRLSRVPGGGARRGMAGRAGGAAVRRLCRRAGRRRRSSNDAAARASWRQERIFRCGQVALATRVILLWLPLEW